MLDVSGNGGFPVVLWFLLAPNTGLVVLHERVHWALFFYIQKLIKYGCYDVIMLDRLGGSPKEQTREESQDEKIRTAMLELYRHQKLLKFATSSVGYDFAIDPLNEKLGNAYPEPVGFKIHIPIDPRHPSFLEILAEAVSICDTPDVQGRPTVMKVAKPPSYTFRDYAPSKQKSIVIYPNSSPKYPGSLRNNLSETLRFDSVLGPKLGEIPGYDETVIKQDLRLPSGLWVRFGQMNSVSPANYLDGSPENRYEPFWDRFVKFKVDSLSLFHIVMELEERGLDVPTEAKEKLRNRMLSER